MLPDAKSLILIAQSLGFSRLGVVSLDQGDALSAPMVHFHRWLQKGYAGDMEYLSRHAAIRARPAQLLDQVPAHLRAIVVTMNYLPGQRVPEEDWREPEWQALRNPAQAVVSVYARGRDYHKVLRSRLVKLADELSQINPPQASPPFQFRACVDSAPVLEVELAQRCGLGWRGKHTLLLNREHGSMFFLGVLLTDMPLPELRFQPLELVEAQSGHCGSCTACLTACPTQAFTGPYELDARRCISYLTIEHRGSIPLELRPLMGNRVYGCDDCQLACPWNRFAGVAQLPDFDVRNGLNAATLAHLFAWTESEFSERHAGSAILRIGYSQWLRNLAVGMGNALARPDLLDAYRQTIITALQARQHDAHELVREHVQWALTAAHSTS